VVAHQRFGCGHGPPHSKLVSEGKPSFTQGGPAQFGLLIVRKLGVKETAFSLGTKSREVATADFGYVRHVSKLLGKQRAPAGIPHLPLPRRCLNEIAISIRGQSYALIY
jgi:hypothetical protein